MSPPVEIKIARGELFTSEVDRALARQRSLQGRTSPAPEPVSLLRRILLSSMFYLPLAGLLGTLGAWLILEPFLGDNPRLAGEVALINNDPFDTNGMMTITIGTKEAVVNQNHVFVFPGARGQPLFESLAEIQVGSVIEIAGDPNQGTDTRLVALAIRPSTVEDAAEVQRQVENEAALAGIAVFPLTATLLALGLLLAEGVARRNWSRLVERGLTGTTLAALFAFIGLIPGGLVFVFGRRLLESNGDSKIALMAFVTCRSITWACAGAGLGAGMNLTRSTPAELRNAVVGGALGGALGGLFFDPIEWLARSTVFDQADVSRAVGLGTIGLAVGVFVALLERLTREAWLRVRTGPLAGKSFILYRSPTTVGSSPSSDIYLFKDAAIDPHHASIHRVGQVYEIEDMGSREGTLVGDQPAQRRRLYSGDQITVGSTVLEFEERAPRPQELGGKPS
jgi:hypothetical protein